MSKEIYISTTPHETRLAVVEDEQLTEIYFERENEYTLAGSIYNGKVTRVLPGMQSSFVDIGLERDAFLYVTDFMEEQGDAADFESDSGSRRQAAPAREAVVREAATPEAATSREAQPAREAQPGREGQTAREGRGRHERGRNRRSERERPEGERTVAPPATETESTESFDEPIAPPPTEAIGTVETDVEGQGSRRWRGRRGRRRGRSLRDEQPATGAAEANVDSAANEASDRDEAQPGFLEGMDAASSPIEIELAEVSTESVGETQQERGGGRGSRNRGRGRSERGGSDRNGSERSSSDRSQAPPREAERTEPAFDNSYAGYMNAEVLPEASGEPVLLPGESIRKYRDPAEVAAEDAEAKRNAPAQAEVLVVAAPDIQITGWDGGAVLPGETLGRNRGRQNNQGAKDSRRESSRRAPAEPVRSQHTHVEEPVSAPLAASPIASEEDFAAAIAPEEPNGLTELPAHTVSEAAVESAAMGQPGDLPGETTPALHTSPEAEYEPEEGASASTEISERRNLRFEQPQEPAANDEARAAESDVEFAGSMPDQTTYDLQASAEQDTPDQTAHLAAPAALEPEPHAALEPFQPEFTTMEATGEMVSHEEASAAEDSLAVSPSEQADFRSAELSAHEEVIHSHEAISEGVPVPTQQGSPEDAGDAAEPSDENGIHAYGDGDFHEEEIEDLDGEDFEYQAAPANLDESEVEYEEETLDGTSDAGSMLHEMYQGGNKPEDEEDDADEEVSSAGGFTEADFGGEPDEDEIVAPEPAVGSGEQRPQREGARRTGMGGSRDRRGGRNSNSGGGGERGRGGRRQSMQTTDLPAINELLKPGQEILVQIAKEPIAKKGARITSHIALPGRFLVFMPTVNHTGVSRKISSDEERRRLKSVLLSEKGDAQGGFIVRTAADGASEEELRNDLRFLIQMWTDIKQRSEASKSPALIYHDLNLVERILRDQVTDNFSAIWVDTEQEYERVLRFLQRFQPSLVRRVKLYTKETPLFEHFGVTAEIEKALKSKVWLKSGGSIVINQTEALVAIDINTGKYVGKTARLEDTILKTNLDAIPEIVRQIRLRDLGGIIVIDFIDMDERKNRAKVMQVLEDAMRTDRAPSKILPFNDFGLVIMTRKRVKQSLERTLCMPDPITDGTGMIKSPITIANEIYVEMRKMHRHLEKTDILLRVHPEVVKTLKLNGGKRLQELEEMTRKTILVKSDPTLSPEAFDIH